MTEPARRPDDVAELSQRLIDTIIAEGDFSNLDRLAILRQVMLCVLSAVGCDCLTPQEKLVRIFWGDGLDYCKRACTS